MKKLVLILVCAMSALFATAQTKITWNAEVGIGTSMWMGDGSDGSKAIFNPRVGVGIDIPLTGLVSFNPTSTFPPQNFPVIQHLQFLHIYCGYYKFSNSTELG